MTPMILKEAESIAAQCRHYAMCKIDFLGTGLCPSGQKKHFVSYYPQGRMDIYHGLGKGLLPITEGLIDVAQSRTLCGICDPQCRFVTGLRPMKVMRALKDYVKQYQKEGGRLQKVEEDGPLKELKEIVGEEWSTGDPALLFAYADDPFPLTGRRMPKHVVLPRTPEEVSSLVKLCRKSRMHLGSPGERGKRIRGSVHRRGGDRHEPDEGPQDRPGEPCPLSS